MNNYIAILHPGKKKGYGILFPDFPGCVSAGRSFNDALREGAEALAFHVEGMRAYDEKSPSPALSNPSARMKTGSNGKTRLSPPCRSCPRPAALSAFR